jgi:hypothetical protein
VKGRIRIGRCKAQEHHDGSDEGRYSGRCHGRYNEQVFPNDGFVLIVCKTV